MIAWFAVVSTTIGALLGGRLGGSKLIDSAPLDLQEDLPCPWCFAATSERDVTCPACHRAFGEPADDALSSGD